MNNLRDFVLNHFFTIIRGYRGGGSAEVFGGGIKGMVPLKTGKGYKFVEIVRARDKTEQSVQIKEVKGLSDHHPLDVWPLPRDQKPMLINEPWLVDESIYFESAKQMMAAREPEDEEDNRRVYIPLDLNKAAFLRRLDYIIAKYPDITWKNESNVSSEVRAILSQIEIYDQLWFYAGGEV